MNFGRRLTIFDLQYSVYAQQHRFRGFFLYLACSSDVWETKVTPNLPSKSTSGLCAVSGQPQAKIQ